MPAPNARAARHSWGCLLAISAACAALTHRLARPAPVMAGPACPLCIPAALPCQRGDGPPMSGTQADTLLSGRAASRLPGIRTSRYHLILSSFCIEKGLNFVFTMMNFVSRCTQISTTSLGGSTPRATVSAPPLRQAFRPEQRSIPIRRLCHLTGTSLHVAMPRQCSGLRVSTRNHHRS